MHVPSPPPTQLTLSHFHPTTLSHVLYVCPRVRYILSINKPSSSPTQHTPLPPNTPLPHLMFYVLPRSSKPAKTLTTTLHPSRCWYITNGSDSSCSSAKIHGCICERQVGVWLVCCWCVGVLYLLVVCCGWVVCCCYFVVVCT